MTYYDHGVVVTRNTLAQKPASDPHESSTGDQGSNDEDHSIKMTYYDHGGVVTRNKKPPTLA